MPPYVVGGLQATFCSKCMCLVTFCKTGLTLHARIAVRKWKSGKIMQYKELVGVEESSAA